MKPKTELHIRKYTASDREAVFTLHKLSLQAANAWLTDRRTWDKDLEDIEGTYLKHGDFLLGEIDGRIVAMGAIRKISDKTCELKRMRVDPEFQRSGYGQMMLKSLETRARELGYDKMILDTTTRLPGARPFYLKNGYHEIGRKIIRVEEIDLEIVYFEKELR